MCCAVVSVACQEESARGVSKSVGSCAMLYAANAVVVYEKSRSMAVLGFSRLVVLVI